MNKSLILALAAAATFAACSTDELVNENVDARHTGQVPIEFSVEKQNITRAANLEDVKHYNFGVWAWKVKGKNELNDQEVMNNYLVGWSNNSNKGYKVDYMKTTTYATLPGSDLNHVSPWFYEGLGTDEYTNTTTPYYTTDSTAYLSNNKNQYLRYWDLAYEKTNFYCYAPYYHHKNATDTMQQVRYAHTSDVIGESVMDFGSKVIRDGYDVPQNFAYDDYSRTLGEFMYAGVQATNANLKDVTVPFKHMGAQLFIRFYEDIPGYKVEIIDLCDDHGKPKSGISANQQLGIQATPAIQTTAPVKYADQAAADAYNAGLTGAWTTSTINTSASTYYTQEEIDAASEGDDAYGKTTSDLKTTVYYTEDECKVHNRTLDGARKVGDMITPGVYANGNYYVTQGAKVFFTETSGAAKYFPSWTNSTKNTNTKPLMFQIPRHNTYETSTVAPGNLTSYPGLNSTTHWVIKEKSNSVQQYSYSPTVYYPVAQPTKGVTATNGTGFTFHVSYRIIAEDNKEVTTVHNATVHVPCIGNASATDPGATTANQWITVWQPNVKYTYTFKITRNSNGTTNPQTEIDPTDPSVDDTVALYPIVFDAATIEDYTTNYSEYVISEEDQTEYNQPY